MSFVQSHLRRKKIGEKISGPFDGFENGISAGVRKICFHFAATRFRFFAGRAFRGGIICQTTRATTARFLRLIQRGFPGQRRVTWALFYPFNLRPPAGVLAISSI